MEIKEFRRKIKANYPHVQIKIKTTSFMDLARGEKKTLKIINDNSLEELNQINNWAKEAGVLPDGGIRFYKQNEN